MPKSQKIFYICLSFIIGIALGDFFQIKILYLSILIGILLIGLLIFHQKLNLIIVLMLFLVFGLVRFQLDRPKIDQQFISFYNEQKIIFQGIIKEPDVRIDQQKLTVTSSQIKINNSWQKVSGNVLVKASLYPQYDYGDLIEVECKLYQPRPIEDFRYDRYLARYNIYSTCSYAKIRLLEKEQGNFLIANLLKLKNKISQTINQTIPEPQASFLAGILIGSRKGIPDDLLQDFNRTGVTHIIAISGYNITVISVMIMNLCLFFNIHRKRAFGVIVIGIIFFVIITGASAAVVRSAIMGIIVLLAKFIGRKSKVNNILAFTCVGMLLVNPKILLDDAGFQLSFLATIGLLYFVPIIEKYFIWLPKKFAIQENFTTTMAAIIWTTPLILFQFHRLSIVAPLVNVLILSFIPMSMAVGFVQVLTGMIWLRLGQVIGWLTWLILEYIIQVVRYFSSLKFASVEIRINLVFMIICYIILLVIILFKHKKKVYEA